MVRDFMVFLQFGRELEMQNDLDVVQLLRKQYQERLEEEVAKVLLLFHYFKICFKNLSILFAIFNYLGTCCNIC